MYKSFPESMKETEEKKLLMLSFSWWIKINKLKDISITWSVHAGHASNGSKLLGRACIDLKIEYDVSLKNHKTFLSLCINTHTHTHTWLPLNLFIEINFQLSDVSKEKKNWTK